MTDREEPVIHDKRRIDPETGKLREGVASAAPSAGAAGPGDGGPAAGAAPAGETPGEQHEDVVEIQPGFAEMKGENARLTDELARANASLYNVNQEYSGYVRRSKEAAAAAHQEGVEKVAAALLPVLDDVALARQHGDLSGPLGSMAEKFEQTLVTNFRLERYGEPGEAFDPLIHEALFDQPTEGVTEPQIAQVLQFGYKVGEKVLRPARVAVATPA